MCNYIIAVLFSAFCLSSLQVNAQDFQLIRKNVQKLNSIPDARARLLKYHALLRRDSLKHQRMLLRKFKHAVDSSVLSTRRPPRWKKGKNRLIQQVPLNRIAADSILGKVEALKQILSDSTLSDSIKVSVKERILEALKSNSNFYFSDRMPLDKGFTFPNQSPQGLDIPGLTINTKPLQDLEKHPLPERIDQQRELSRISGPIQNFPTSAMDSTDLKGIQMEIMREGASRLASSKQFAAGQSVVSKMLSKYREFSNSADPGTAVKRISLKGRPFRERLFFGLNVSPLSVEPFAVGVAPQIGFKLNRNFLIGAALNYRMAFSDTTETRFSIGSQLFSYRALTSLTLKRSFFVYAETELSPVTVQRNDGFAHLGQTNFSAGLGKRFLVHPKLYFNVVTLYRLNGLRRRGFPCKSVQYTYRRGVK